MAEVKKAVILHGTDGDPNANWFPWLKKQLEDKGYKVWVPHLPNNHTPNRQVYNDFLHSGGWDFTDNLVFGHSSGAVSVLNLLEDTRTPKIKAGILAGVWSHMEGTELDFEQFKDLFTPRGFNFRLIKQKASKLIFVHGDDDPHCPLDQAQWLAKQTDSQIIIIPGGKHFSVSTNPTYTEFPKLVEILEEQKVL
jgi:uncharacterized protein